MNHQESDEEPVSSGYGLFDCLALDNCATPVSLTCVKACSAMPYYGKETTSSGRIVFVRFDELSERKSWISADSPENGIFRRAVLTHDLELKSILVSGAKWQSWSGSGKYTVILHEGAANDL